MMHKAWCSIEEVPCCFPRPSIKFQGHKGQKIDDLDQIWARLLGRSQLSNPSDLPCSILSHVVQSSCNLKWRGHYVSISDTVHIGWQCHSLPCPNEQGSCRKDWVSWSDEAIYYLSPCRQLKLQQQQHSLKSILITVAQWMKFFAAVPCPFGYLPGQQSRLAQRCPNVGNVGTDVGATLSQPTLLSG